MRNLLVAFCFLVINSLFSIPNILPSDTLKSKGENSISLLAPPTETNSTKRVLLVNATTQSSSITLSWVTYGTATGYIVNRKLKNDASWGNSIATLGASATGYVDNSVSPGTYYEYKITRNSSLGVAYGYVATGINVNSPDYRGKIVLVIDNTFVSNLSNEINQLKLDLKRDGWSVVEVIANRTDYPVFARTQIQNIYNSDPSNVKAVYLLGHVPIYRGGNIAPDGHENRPFAGDAYYGDMSANTWVPVPTTIPSAMELGVGRVDLYNMPAFGISEEQMLRNYLLKAHNFKEKQFTPPARGLIKDYLSWVSNPLAEQSYRNMAPLVGNNNINTLSCATCLNDGISFVSESSNGYLWTFGSGGGTYFSADGIGQTQDFVTTAHNGIFNMTFGSYFGNWDPINPEANCFLKAPLASGKALTSVWAGQPSWWFHHMGMGDEIGYSVKMSVNNVGTSALYQPQNMGWSGNNYTTMAMSLLGDPSLRMNYVSPPTSLNITNNGSSLSFSWNASSESVLGYYLYDMSSGIPVRAHPNLITTNSFSGSFSGSEYMVRAVKLEVTPSGTYYNLSLGSISTVPAPTVGVSVSCKAMLQGPVNGTLMNDNLRSLGLIPLNDPNPLIGYTYVGGSPTTSISQSVLSVTGNSAIVDWMIVELRNPLDSSSVVYSRSALIQRDGDVVSLDGVSPISFPVAPGQYYLSLRHRNHLGIMTASRVNLSQTTFSINFANGSVPTYGSSAQTSTTAGLALWSGDCNFNKIISYTGVNNDRDLILSRIGGVIPTNTLNGYYSEDLNMDGIVKYTGSNNDRDIVLSAIGGIVPTNTRLQQIP